jgi:hypothetical protein
VRSARLTVAGAQALAGRGVAGLYRHSATATQCVDMGAFEPGRPWHARCVGSSAEREKLMIIDRTSFMVAVGSLLVGGAGGYYAGERALLQPTPVVGVTDLQPPPSRPIAEPVATTAAPAAPVCDDTVGTAGECPVPGYPSEEGVGCGPIANKRCQDFKQTMKPRVAERAVACLNGLNAAQRCDASRDNLCGHLALMNACPEPEGAVVAGVPAADDLTTRCTSIVQGCGATGLTPPVRECRATLAGLSSFGRDQMASCMRTHCADKGLVGCEAVIAPQ